MCDNSVWGVGGGEGVIFYLGAISILMDSCRLVQPESISVFFTRLVFSEICFLGGGGGKE
jgi:hypothetical protein